MERNLYLLTLFKNRRWVDKATFFLELANYECCFLFSIKPYMKRKRCDADWSATHLFYYMSSFLYLQDAQSHRALYQSS